MDKGTDHGLATRSTRRLIPIDLEEGFLTAQFIAVTALSLLVLVMLANLIVVQYGRGVVRSAADEGAQTGSLLGAKVGACEAKAHEVVDNLLGGPMSDDVGVVCFANNLKVTSTISYSFEPWLPLVPVISGTEQSVAVREKVP